MDWFATLESWFISVNADPELFRIVAVAAFALLGFFVTLVIVYIGSDALSPLRRRVARVGEAQVIRTKGERLSRAMERLGRSLTPLDEKKRGKADINLLRAGFRSPRALPVFLALKVAAMVTLPVVIFGFTMLLGDLPLKQKLAVTFVGVPFAFMLPDLVLARLMRKRQLRMRRALPDALDMMVICSEAGLGLLASIQRVGQEIELQHAELAGEFQTLIMQTRAGMESRTALKELETRIGIDDVRAFVTTILQALRFGTSIAESLRVFSDEMRDKRLQRAQEQAAKLGVKMMIPIAFLMMPAFLLVAIGPPLLRLFKIFTSMGL